MHRAKIFPKPKFKFFSGQSKLIEAMATRQGWDKVKREFDLLDCDPEPYYWDVEEFPHQCTYLRHGFFWFPRWKDLYYVRPNGDCYLVKNGHIDAFFIDHPLLSEKEYQTIENLIQVVGRDGVSQKWLKKWDYHNEFMVLNKIRLYCKSKIRVKSRRLKSAN